MYNESVIYCLYIMKHLLKFRWAVKTFFFGIGMGLRQRWGTCGLLSPEVGPSVAGDLKVKYITAGSTETTTEKLLID